MSTDFIPEKVVDFDRLFDGCLAQFGISEITNENTTATRRLLTDGQNCLWVYGDGEVGCFTRYFPNGNPSGILSAIAEIFDTKIYSEYQPEYWGFDTQAEWEAAMDAIAREFEEELYRDLINYIAEWPDGIESDTINKHMAIIARELVSAEPRLALPEMKDEFMQLVNELYEREHVVTVELTAEEIQSIQHRFKT